MSDKKIPESPSASLRPLIPAGYTYFGQFIDHDMTFEDFRLLEDREVREPRDTANLRANWLCLDNLYGDGPGGSHDYLYAEDHASFRVGRVTDRNRSLDVPIDKSSGRPLAADVRNLENAIVRQLHALFLQLHNKAVEELPAHLPPASRFAKARLRVCHQYQWLVRHDFLARICDPRIYAEILEEPIIDWQGQFSIPVEFARAAFRFGHSMVRDTYELDEIGTSIGLSDLFGRMDSVGPVPTAHAVPWMNFLGPGRTSRETAKHIDTSIVSALFKVPKPSSRLFEAFANLEVSDASRDDHPEPVLVLPYITLQRGADSRLPCGEFVRRALNAPPITAKPGPWDPWSSVVACGLRNEIPLWYHILLEAEVNNDGCCLGPVGSRIVSEVIEGALWATRTSFLRMHGRLWKPEPWSTKDGNKQVYTLGDLAELVEPEDGR